MISILLLIVNTIVKVFNFIIKRIIIGLLVIPIVNIIKSIFKRKD